MTKEIVLALIAKVRPYAKIEPMLSDVVLAYGVIARMLQEVEEREYALLRELGPPVLERRRRAAPYRVEGGEVLSKPRIPLAEVLPEGRSQSPVLMRRSKNGRKVSV